MTPSFLSSLKRLSLSLMLLGGLLGAPAVSAADIKIGTVDFQAAMEQIEEGKTAVARFDGIRTEKTKRIEKLQANLQQMQTDLQNQAGILSEAARRDKMTAFEAARAQYQQEAMTAEQELQNTYMQMMNELVAKMSEVAAQIGKEKGYTVILEKNEGGLVYTAEGMDITPELIKRYNAARATPAK